jgi:hypothetical protein
MQIKFLLHLEAAFKDEHKIHQIVLDEDDIENIMYAIYKLYPMVSSLWQATGHRIDGDSSKNLESKLKTSPDFTATFGITAILETIMPDGTIRYFKLEEAIVL